jgi:hypothetical protein
MQKNKNSLANLIPLKKGYDPNRNMKGAPKKLPGLKELVQNELSEMVGGKTKNQIIIAKQTELAMRGNLNSANSLWDRGFGKADLSEEAAAEIKVVVEYIDKTDEG